MLRLNCSLRSIVLRNSIGRPELSNYARFYSPPRTKKTAELNPFDILDQAKTQDAATAEEDIDIDSLDWSHLEQPERKFTEQFSATSQPRNEQREEMIFKEVLGNVLSSPRNARSKDTVKDSENSTLSNSILALFEPDATGKSTAKQSPTIASLLDGITDSSKSIAATNAESLKKRERAEKVLQHVLSHIDSLETNSEVMRYFEDTVMPTFSEDNRIPPDEMLMSAESPAIGSETSSYVLEKCITTLAIQFNDPVGALHLFEVAKRHSIEFYADACSADVYNEVIRIRWDEYRDLYAVVNLAAEIAINAIPPNLGTTEILSKVYRDATESASGLSATAHGLPLWTGQDEKRLEELNRYRARFQSAWASRPVLRF